MKIFCLIAWLLASAQCFGQDYLHQYQVLQQENQQGKILPLLKEWQKAKPDDPEMFIGFFNYYLQNSKQEVLQLDNSEGHGDNLVISDTANGEAVGYIHEGALYNDSLFNLAQEYLLKGIAKNPQRMDMHFGRIYSLQNRGMDSLEVEAILNLLLLNQEFKAKGWLWSQNQPVEDVHTKLRGAIQSYVYNLFNRVDPPIRGIELISMKMIDQYPGDPENYANLGVCSLMKGDLQRALKHFQQAHQKSPDDIIVLNNIAYTYQQMGNLEKAKEYFRMIIKEGTEEQAEDAQYQLEAIERAEKEIK